MIRRPARSTGRSILTALALLGPWSLSRPALAAEAEATVVKNRIYADDGRFDLQLNYSFGVANTMTATQGIVLTAAYHLTEAFAIEVLAGYFFGGATDLAGQTQCPGAPSSGGSANCVDATGKPFVVNGQAVGPSIFSGATGKTFSDVPNLWTLNGLNLQAGLRWEPVYGKLSLLTAFPVHFKWFLALDGGVAQFSRNSLNFCTNYNAALNGMTGDCAINETGNQVYNPQTGSGSSTYSTLQESQWSWVASAATGFRFVFLRQGTINLGLREYVWGDSYRVNFTASQFSKTPASSIQTSGGLTASLFADLGLGWTF